jgi:uncharacterized protein
MRNTVTGVSKAAPRSTVSSDIFVVPQDNGRYLIYAPLKRAAFVGNAATVNVLAALRDGKFPACADAENLLAFFRFLQLIDCDDTAPPITVYEGSPEPVAVTLFMSTACNLRCKYCYASAGDTRKATMPEGVARRAIDFVSSNAARRGLDQFEVGYHGGGEATTNWRVMVASLAYARQRAAALNLRVAAGAASNGMLNKDQVSWFIDNLASATISLDGIPEVQDRNRPTRTGLGSSARVAQTLKAFDDAGFAYDIRLTVTAEDIPFLVESVHFVLSNFKPHNVQVEPVYQLGRWSEGPSAETEDFIQAFREARTLSKQHGIDLAYSAARLDLLTNHFCGVSQDSFCVSPDGNVSACYEAFSEETRWGHVFFYGRPSEGSSGYDFDLERLGHLRNQAVQHKPYCQGCFAKWHCAGDCYHKSLRSDPREEFRGSGRCFITRALTMDLILERIEASGGLYWRGDASELMHNCTTPTHRPSSNNTEDALDSSCAVSGGADGR